MAPISSILFYFSLVQSIFCLGQSPTIAFDNGGLQLAGVGTAGLILSSKEPWGVLKAGSDLATDFGRVTGANLAVYNTSDPIAATTSPHSGPVIIAGTIGYSSLIGDLISEGKIDVSAIQGKWESFQSEIVQNPMAGLSSALVVVGSTKRGTIYGIYDISEQIGVSPWYYWADVPSTPRTNIYAMDVKKVQGPPSVKYRGIFLNDEQPCLTGWVNANFGSPGYVSTFYIRVFELLLRLRANYLWPTMWDSMFAIDDAQNQPLADKYGIVMGTSHTEPLMRSTKEQSTYLSGSWDWKSNKANIITFLTAGAKRAAPYESLFTMGMRGSGDTSSPTLDAASLTDVITSQQTILSNQFGASNLSQVPQMWCLYKEVGGYYQAGMKVPDEITLLWSDDNSGNLQRLPLPTETSRAGGAGVYYHIDYVGDPRNYKWINTISLTKTWEQMHLAYSRSADRIWVVNVGDLKPLELPISHFLDMAYDMNQFATADSTVAWISKWATREFGNSYADNAATIISQYSQYAARRKYELISPSTFSLVNYNEADRMLTEWGSLVANATALYNSMSTTLQSPFFEMVLHPCMAGYLVYQVYVNAAYNALYKSQGRVSTVYVGEATISAFTQDAGLSARYNNMLNGKWRHFMDQVHIGYTIWQDPSTNIMPALSYPSSSATLAPGLSVEGGSTSLTLPLMDQFGPDARWIDLYSRSNSTSAWTSSTDAWIILKPSSGTLKAPGITTSDQRIQISVDWSMAPNSTSTSIIAIIAGNTSFKITLPLSHTFVPSNFSGHIESDKTISIEAQSYFSDTGSDSIGRYQVIPGYGRTLSGVTLLPVTIDTQNPTSSTAPKLSYPVYIFTATTANITVYLGPSLNTNPSRPLKYAIAIDNAAPTTAQYVPVTNLGTLPTGWSDAVQNAGWKYTTTHAVTVGPHVLNLWALEPGVVFQKIVIDLGGVRASYLGPPESSRQFAR